MNSKKEKITQAVIQQQPTGWTEWTMDDAMVKWWQTGRRSDGLRLTEIGDMAFRLGEIEFYQYDFIPKAMENYHSYILDLNKKIKCPYFLGVNRVQGKKNQPYIRLYDSKIAMLISLYGTLDEYLKSVKVRQ
jgi:hypothetical protein